MFGQENYTQNSQQEIIEPFFLCYCWVRADGVNRCTDELGDECY